MENAQQPSLVNTEQAPPILPPKKNDKLKVLGLGFVIIFLLFVIGGGGYYLGTKKDTPIENPSNTTISITPQPTSLPSTKTEQLDLYGLSIELPTNWTLEEVNRRPEPTGPGDPVKGHGCADYEIKSAENYVTLSLKPICGFADGGADTLPLDAVVVKDLGDKEIVRIKKGTGYEYGISGEVEFTEKDNSKIMKKMYTRVLSYGENQDLIFIGTGLIYSGPEQEKDKYLDEADMIVSSLKLN